MDKFSFADGSKNWGIFVRRSKQIQIALRKNDILRPKQSVLCK